MAQPMATGFKPKPDFDADATNTLEGYKVPKGNLTPGVESGLSKVESLGKTIQPEQMTHGENFRLNRTAESVSANGKNFTIGV